MEPIIIPLGELRIESGWTTLVCQGLGSCIALFAVDPIANVAGMAHILLPNSILAKNSEKSNRFADIAVPNLLQALVKAGCRRERLVFIIAGGAQLFEVAKANKKIDVGSRNIAAVQQALKKINAPLYAADTGGTVGRTLTADCESGLVTVRTTLGAEKPLFKFRNQGDTRAA